jgi:hypothetical protein
MSEPARRPATYEDLVALPDNVVGEIIHGELTRVHGRRDPMDSRLLGWARLWWV